MALKKENKKNKYKMKLKLSGEQSRQLKDKLNQEGIMTMNTEYDDKKSTLVFNSTDTETRKKIRSTLKQQQPIEPKIQTKNKTY